MAAATAQDPVDLQARCEACSALCCVTHPFDADQGFGFDKAAHTPCKHLQDDFRCGIHDELEDKGCTGCALYSCHGAGQRVTRLYGELNWRAAPAQALDIYTVFSQMKSLHELQFLLGTAQQLTSDETLQQRVNEQRGEVEALCRSLEQHRTVLDLETIRERTYSLLRLLATQPAVMALRSTRLARG